MVRARGKILKGPGFILFSRKDNTWQWLVWNYYYNLIKPRYIIVLIYFELAIIIPT